MSLSSCSSELDKIPEKKVPTATERAIAEKTKRAAGVSTGPSLELCTAPSTLGSAVAAAALEQLLSVEQSLQSDYFTCNEEARIFLKDIAAAVKRLEQMRKSTIDLLEIETMELSRRYCLLEILPNCYNREMEECVIDARNANIFEINQLYRKIAIVDTDIEFMKKRILELDGINKALGEKQGELVKQHEKFVLSLNLTMSKKATATIYINEMHTKINLEKEEIEVQKQRAEAAKEKLGKEKEEYTLRKNQLKIKIEELINISEDKKIKTYSKKKELDKLTVKMSRIKQTVASTTVVLSDHNLEIGHKNEEIKEWEAKVEELKKVQKTLEDKIRFFTTNKENLDQVSNSQKEEFLEKIKQVAENVHQAHLENRNLRDKLTTLAKQCKIVLSEEEEMFTRRREIYNENQKQQQFLAQKEAYLAQRKVDIKNMEEGLKTLEELHQAKQEMYRKQIKIMGDNLEREKQRGVITQWKIASLLKQHGRWVTALKEEIKKLLEKIEATQQRKEELSKETRHREEEINLFVAQIEQLAIELREEENKFVYKEKQLLEELHNFEDQLVKEVKLHKEREGELVECLPQLREVEEEFSEKHRRFEELTSIHTAQKQEETLLINTIGQLKRDFSRYSHHMDQMKQDLKYFREQESINIKEHFEILKNLENEIYVYDQKTELLLLENERIKTYISDLVKEIEEYTKKEDNFVHVSSDQSWQLKAKQAQHIELCSGFQGSVKEFVHSGKKMMQEITSLVEKLSARGEKIEHISAWLEGSLHELCSLREDDSPKKPNVKAAMKNPERVYS